jgi:hypothetical protein
MDEKISNIIWTVFAEIENDDEDDSEELLNYYLRCTAKERAVVDNVLMYLCGWTMKAILCNVSSLPIMEKGEQFLKVIEIFALLCSHYKMSL